MMVEEKMELELVNGERIGWYWYLGLAGVLVLLVCLDIELLRGYFGLRLGSWLWDVEHYLSAYSHLVAIGVGLVVLGVRGGKKWLWHGAAVVVVGSLVVMFLKFGIGRVRPGNGGDPFLFFGVNMVHDSYPSGHSVAIWGMVLVMWRFMRGLGLVWMVVGILVGWARLHAQAHYLSDIFAGVVVAFGCERVLWWGWFAEMKSGGGLRWWLRTGGPWLMVVMLPMLGTLPMRSAVEPVRSDAEYEVLIREMYRRLMVREVDAGAFDLWMEELPLRRVVSDPVFQFAVSREFADSVSAGAGGVEEEVGEVYFRLLDREPGAVELAEGVELLAGLDNGRAHRYGVRLLATRLVLSAEYLAKYGAFYLPGEIEIDEG